MGNSRTRKINYIPRLTDLEAYDLLPLPIRDALKEGANEWCAYAAYRYWQDLLKTERPSKAVKILVSDINLWHQEEIDKGAVWRDRKPGETWQQVPPSPHNQARATMQMSGAVHG